MNKENKEFIIKHINELSAGLNEINQLLSSDELKMWSKALHLANLNGFDDLYHYIKDVIVKHFAEMVQGIDLEMPLYDLEGNYHSKFAITYKDEHIAYFEPDSNVFLVVESNDQIALYKHMQSVTKRDYSAKIAKQKEATPYLQILTGQMIAFGYEIMKD